MTAIIDYGAGNIFSVKNALDHIGCESEFTSDPERIKAADRLILPGVGAFPKAAEMLRSKGLWELMKEQAKIKPFLGICLGMQLMFDKSLEFGETEGLGLVHGTVELMETGELSLPHIGWNSLEFTKECPIFSGIAEGSYVYFVHSYAAVCNETAGSAVSAVCDYAGKRTAAAYDGKYAFGCQFHPEKSGETGLRILRNFAAMK